MEPRPAATVILARPAAPGVEVLVLTRGQANSFLPGFAVFPGGVIDQSDERLASELFGSPAESARACALRELVEETGILLTADGPTHSPSRALEGLEFRPPPVDSLIEVSRWIAPEFLETRFDARFFATAVSSDLEPVVDGVEIAEARWASPSDIADAADGGEVQVMWPTLVTMRALAGCRDVSDVLELRVEQVPNPGALR